MNCFDNRLIKVAPAQNGLQHLSGACFRSMLNDAGVLDC